MVKCWLNQSKRLVKISPLVGFADQTGPRVNFSALFNCLSVIHRTNLMMTGMTAGIMSDIYGVSGSKHVVASKLEVHQRLPQVHHHRQGQSRLLPKSLLLS